MSLRKNTLWNLFGSSLPLITAVLCIPYCLNNLGGEAFGVLTLIWALVGYFSLFDLGAGRALTYEISRLQNDALKAKVPSVLRAGLLLTILAGLAGTSIEWTDPSTNDGENGIVAVHLKTATGVVVLD